MSRGKKTDTETKVKVIEAKINNPDLSTRDMERDLGVAHETVAKVLREDLAQVCTQSERIAKLIDTNNKLQSLADQRLQELLETKEEKLRASDLVSIRESTFKQNQVVQGLASDKVDGNFTIKWES